MKPFDFDVTTQKLMNRYYSITPDIEWKKWLELDSMEAFIEEALKNSGLSRQKGIFERLKTQKTDSRQFAVEFKKFIEVHSFAVPPILCHTSGTTNSNPDALKWFHMSKPLIKRLWAPGMRAIFESSGLSSDSSAVIFVPSRMHFDGVNEHNGTRYTSLYSSEFSQRLVLSMFKPQSYVLYPYRKAYNLDVISQILQLDHVSVVSAPSATILKWADLTRLKSGIQKSLHTAESPKNIEHLDLYQLIKQEGIEHAAKEIQNRLSDKLSNAILIFSISSLNESRWAKIRAFMKWEKGKERFTNLYVGSEIGPFASSIPLKSFDVSRANKMYVFPLTLPVLQYRNQKKLLTQVANSTGKLLISRLHNATPQINIDTGDVISVLNGDEPSANVPMIGGNILRAEFTLKYDIKINEKIQTSSRPKILTGDFFTFEKFDIESSRSVLNYLKKECSLPYSSLVLNKEAEGSWTLFVPAEKEICSSGGKIASLFRAWSDEPSLKAAINDNHIEIKVLSEELVDFLAPREKVVEKVRKGVYPKGILKKWPLYVIKPSK